jgi:RNA ligase (TIGR02306 family)
LNPNRALATIAVVAEIAPIPDADRIERAKIRGWHCVVLKEDRLSPGDRVVYFEIDSLLDVERPQFEFLSKHGVRTDKYGRTGAVLRTMRFRGQYSQGMAIPLSQFPELDMGLPEGADVTDQLGVVGWEPALPPELDGVARGKLPGWTPTTDEERVQNLGDGIFATADQADWVATEKLDGVSVTYYFDPTTDHLYSACSRGRDLVHNPDSTQYRLAGELNIWPNLSALSVMRDGCRVAIQGEIVGPGIQGNPLRLPEHQFKIFNFIVEGQQIPRLDWPDWVLCHSVPIYWNLPFPQTADQALQDVDGLQSLLATGRPAEGVVWRAADRNTVLLPNGLIIPASFKVISNRYLLKHDI